MNLEKGDFIPIIDIEKYPGKEDIETSHFELIKNLKIFINQLEVNYNIDKVLIYSGNKYFQKYLKGYFPEHLFWLARWNKTESPIGFGEEKNIVGWQFTSKTKIPGIDVNSVDTNVFLKKHLDSIQVK